MYSLIYVHIHIFTGRNTYVNRNTCVDRVSVNTGVRFLNPYWANLVSRRAFVTKCYCNLRLITGLGIFYIIVMRTVSKRR